MNSSGEVPDVFPLRLVPYMGVIYVVAEASKLGFWNGNPEWSNLGQGQPEVGPMAGAPARIEAVTLDPADHAYGHIGGTDELKEAVAAHYNRLYRRGKKSQYTAENVSIAQGGRLSLSRALAALGHCTVGHQLPDYTAYEDMFELHMGRVKPVGVVAHEADGFKLPAARLTEEVRQKELDAFLISNPCNPTGNLLAGDELRDVVELGRRRNCLFLLDEFYSHFVYHEDGSPAEAPVSSAEFIEDVDLDPVLLFDGLTKCYRYPGWRIGWCLGPKHWIEVLDRVGSSMDGGPSRVAQRAALAALEATQADQETTALRQVFAQKRNVMVRALKELGITFAAEPLSTFYCWGSLANLPEPLNDAMEFFRQALKHRVMTVPGQFFDVNPGKLRPGPSPYAQWMRFSFGPPLDNIQAGLERLKQMMAQVPV